MLDRQDLDAVHDLARPREGHVDRWVRAVVWLAVIATFVVLFVGPRVLWARDRDSIEMAAPMFRNTLALGFLVTMVLAWLPGGRVSRAVRLAVLLPIVQVVAMIVAWVAWTLLRDQLPTAADSVPVFDKLPITVALPAIALAVPCGALLVARPKKREVVHASVMIALVFLLLLGLWLPFAAASFDGVGWSEWLGIESALRRPARLIADIMVPPFACAVMFTAIALRWPDFVRRHTRAACIVIGVLVGGAAAARHDTYGVGTFVYANFMHVLGCAAIVAVAAIAALGVTTWIANRRAARIGDDALVGTITGDRTVAALALTSWLRGPEPRSDAFTVRTAGGDVPVPAGVRVVAPTPLATTLLRTGEITGTLKAGDRVALAGFVTGHGDGPFRATAAPIAGEHGITVTRTGETYGLGHVALDLWRPSVAYLVICVAVALPGLAALI